jgi:hypothetical protein
MISQELPLEDDWCRFFKYFFVVIQANFFLNIRLFLISFGRVHSMIEKLAIYTDIRCCLIVGGLSKKVRLLFQFHDALFMPE